MKWETTWPTRLVRLSWNRSSKKGFPFLGAALGVVLDNAFIGGVEEAARFTFQERWLREHGKVDEIAPALSSQGDNAPIVEGLSQAVYSTSYAVSFGVVFPAALLGCALSTVLPAGGDRRH